MQFGDSQSMHSYRASSNAEAADNQSATTQFEDQVSLRSLPITHHPQGSLHSAHVLSNLNPPRSMSPVSSMSGDELSHGGRRSQRRRPLLDKQVNFDAF